MRKQIRRTRPASRAAASAALAEAPPPPPLTRAEVERDILERNFRCRGPANQDWGAVRQKMQGAGARAAALPAHLAPIVTAAVADGADPEALVARLRKAKVPEDTVPHVLAAHRRAQVRTALATVPAEATTTDHVISHLLAAGERNAAADVDHNRRAWCGADLGAVILAGPIDGEEHAAPCPRCGTVFRYTPPFVSV